MNVARRVLVTGGAGYIGSHTCKRLAADGIECVVYDNLSSGHRHNVRWGDLVVGDIRDGERLAETLRRWKPEAVIHFAALAYVGESVAEPARYYRNNVVGTLTLLSEMLKQQIGTIVFSSTCATYGIPETLPIRETTPQQPINPYGASKLMVERILEDFGHAYGLRYAALRYFNACGADLEGELAEEHDPETHLIPRCLMAAAGLIPTVEVFGDDYPTPDGTCIRDYIHVSDLAAGHVAALRALTGGAAALKLNLGTGRGVSIREILDGVQRVTGRNVPYAMRPRRAGDPPALLADVSAARDAIGFIAQHSELDTILRTAWAQFAQR
ncbi:MAG: UDP-glucose 4-epimerase GalE [Methylobacterium sp.]|jgi:UDP-arabinose 4-epimerase|uniref:UDP-glucose 4-epimerase GalE n=1 Tax=Methylobacterium sp. TaxID=409 RepID=UPI0025D633BC|nr:UDP-glucose 4-epimerase GalE [Methylobacterium sp.]MBX9934791.1 UDP-glucose 4-epimerase GalE [Methylobacterium sp.]